MLLLPAVLVVFGVVLYPVARTLVVSLYDVTSSMPGDYPFVGLDNYTRVFEDSGFYSALGHTMYFTLVSTSLELVLGIAVALLLNTPLRARWLWRSIVVLPWALPTIVNGSMWRWIYNGQYGALNGLLDTLGISDEPTQWLGSPFLALNMVIVADVWKNTSIVVFFILAGLQTIPDELYEAARIDGAGPVADLLASHSATARSGHRRGAHPPHDRGVQGVRHHLRDDRRRARQRHPDRGVLHLPPSLQSTSSSATARRWPT